MVHKNFYLRLSGKIIIVLEYNYECKTIKKQDNYSLRI